MAPAPGKTPPHSARPLLAGDSAPADSLDGRTSEEEDLLLTGQYKGSEYQPYGWRFWRQTGLLVWAILATLGVLALAFTNRQHLPSPSSKAPHSHPSGKRNLIFMVSDGMGPTSLSLTRSFRQHVDLLPINDTLVLDRHLIGSSRTRSSNSLVTDSAAGATAFSCGMKSYNGAISVLPEAGHPPCGTVLEAAKRAGYLTGLVVTTRITDATPACFAAHVPSRSMEDRIAAQMVGDHPLGRVVDLMLGGGRCHFLPQSTNGSCREDGHDIVQLAQSKGFTYIDDRGGFDALKEGASAKLPLLGLFAPTDIPYEIDRRNQSETYPSLNEMARTALQALSLATKDSDQGFFLMIEGSRIDHAGHGNDPAAQVHEVLAYDKAFASALDFVQQDSVDGVVVSTSDHETGGLATARQLHEAYPDYLWYPGVLANVSHSAEYMARQFHATMHQHDAGARPLTGDERRGHLRQLVASGLGITDATDAELDALANTESSLQHAYLLADMVSRRAQNGWTTHGHSAVDVNIYASSAADAAALVANHENTEVGQFLRDYLDLDLAPITDELRNAQSQGFRMGIDSVISPVTPDSNSPSAAPYLPNGPASSVNPPPGSWMGASDPARVPAAPDAAIVDHYTGDFRRRSDLDCGC